MAVLTGVKFYAPVVIEMGGNQSISSEGLDYSKVTIGDTQRFVGSSELNTVTCREVMDTLPIDADARKSARIVIG